MPITKQTIAIIGAGGNVGAAIAKNIASGNYRLLLFDMDREKLKALSEEIHRRHPKADLEQMNCAYDCSWEADIVIMAVPYDQEKDIAEKIHDVVTQKIVISFANHTGIEELQQQLPHSRVVKMFNTLFAEALEQPLIEGKKIDAFITGDDKRTLEIVAELAEKAGFNPMKNLF